MIQDSTGILIKMSYRKRGMALRTQIKIVDIAVVNKKVSYCRDRGSEMFRVIQYFTKSLNVIRNDTLQ